MLKKLRCLFLLALAIFYPCQQALAIDCANPKRGNVNEAALFYIKYHPIIFIGKIVSLKFYRLEGDFAVAKAVYLISEVISGGLPKNIKGYRITICDYCTDKGLSENYSKYIGNDYLVFGSLDKKNDFNADICQPEIALGDIEPGLIDALKAALIKH